MTSKQSNAYALPDHASPECHVDRCRFTTHPTGDRGKLLISLGECRESLEMNNTRKCFRLRDRIDIARANQKPLLT